MNLLEHYILEVLSEKEVERKGVKYYIVKAKVDCHGCEEIINDVFTKETWEMAKKEGYYLA